MKVSLITPDHGMAFSPMKIMQDMGDEDRKYLVMNSYHHEPFKEIISTKSKYVDPFLTSNPLLLSASSHREDHMYYRHVDSPIAFSAAQSHAQRVPPWIQRHCYDRSLWAGGGSPDGPHHGRVQSEQSERWRVKTE